MRVLKILTIAMGVLIVVATTVLVVLIARRIGGGVGQPASVALLLDEPRAHGSRRSLRRGIGWQCNCKAEAPIACCLSIRATAVLPGG